MGCSQSTPVQEPVAAAPASNVSAGVAAPGSVSSSQAAAAPVSNVSGANAAAAAQSAPSSTAPSNKTVFAISGVSITEQGIVYYHIEAADGSESIKKRFNDFKQLYAKLPNSSLLPPLPAANLGTLFRGKHNPAMIKEREQQFAVVLNAIGNNAAFASTDAFQDFLKP